MKLKEAFEKNRLGYDGLTFLREEESQSWAAIKSNDVYPIGVSYA